MSKRLTYEFVKEQFEKEKWELLSKEYINAHTKLRYKCLKSHEHSITWNDWKAGNRCPYCAGQGKPTIEFIGSKLAEKGCILLTTEYINSKQKLEYICPNGHRHSIFWTNWQQGRDGCSYCSGYIRKTIKFVRSEFAKEGYKLDAEEYINNNQKLDYTCPDGHKHSISWNSWQLGHRCPTCFHIKYSGPNSNLWKGGIACEPYCEIWIEPEFKQMILERDNYQCQNSDCWGTGSKLMRHHIDYNKKNCDPFNIITVCNSCNSRANFNRDYWQKFYKEVIKRKLYRYREV